MALRNLAHYSIRTTELENCRIFYCEVLGLRAGYRPSFPFPGFWLYQDADESTYGVVHLIDTGGEQDAALNDYLGEDTSPAREGTGALDHIAFIASDWGETRARFKQRQVPFHERRVPDLGLHQVFLKDPNGIVIELNYPADEG